MTVCVGPDCKAIDVHRDLICASSPFFKAALGPGWKESEERVVSLPEDDPSAFDLYVTWLYTQGITSNYSWDEDPERGREYRLLAECFALAEKLLDSQFQKCLVDTVIATVKDRKPGGMCYYPPSTVIRNVYERTCQSAPLRRLLVDMWAWSAGISWFPEGSDFPPEFLLDFARKVTEIRTKPSGMRPYDENPGAYYAGPAENVKKDQKPV